MKKYLRFLLVFFTIGQISCDYHKEIEGTEMRYAFVINSSANFKGYYYQGSDKSYHYFVSKWDFLKDRYFKLPIDSLTIESKYKSVFGDKELQIDVFAKDNELFGQSIFCKLYVLKTLN